MNREPANTDSRAIRRPRLGGARVDVMPVPSLRYFVMSVLLALCCLAALDKIVMPRMERNGRLPTTAWQTESELLNRNMERRNLCSKEDPVWRSAGFPVRAEKVKPHRILVLGDSFVWGDGLANMNDIWWRQLQRELARRGYREVEIIAAGERGASTSQQLGYAKKVVPQYRPDLLIWGYVTNDPDEQSVERLTPRKTGLVVGPDDFFDAGLDCIKPLFPMFADRCAALRSTKRSFLASGKGHGFEYSEWELRLLEDGNLERYGKTLSSVKEFCSKTGIQAFTLTLPNHPTESYFKPRYDKVQPLFESAGIPFFNILPDFVRDYGSKLDLLAFRSTPTNGHPGPLATHYFAVKAADILERNYAPVLGQRTAPKPESRPHVNDWLPGDMSVARPGENEVSFSYPPSDTNMPRMPIGNPYVQLNLEEPVSLEEIRVEGINLVSARLYVTTTDPRHGYDDRRMIGQGRKAGKRMDWLLNTGLPVSTVRIAAEFTPSPCVVTVTMIPKAGRK